MSIQEQLKKQANQLTALLDIDAPLIGAPMMGATTAQMVAEISNAGGLGSKHRRQTAPPCSRSSQGWS